MPAAAPVPAPEIPLLPTAPRTFGSALEERAARRRAFLAVLDLPCRAHHAARGEPCWPLPADTRDHSGAVCGARVEAYRARVHR